MLALARKYRPRTFASVAVQSHVSNTLRGAIARGRVAHGYLLCGPRGTGKTTLARVLAMALNCERRLTLARQAILCSPPGGAPSADADDARGGEPCGVCESCSRIWRGDASLDVVEIDAASNRGVDDARDLRERAMYAPSGDDRYKVYIVDEAHMLTREAWNALLKVLEEPPPRVIFVFATTEPQKIAQTAAPVLSRLQRFDLKRIGTADVRARLTEVLGLEGVPFDGDALAMLARAADGSMRDALSLTDQVLAMGAGTVTAERVRDALGLVPEDEYLALLDVVAERRAADVFARVGRLADAGIDFGGLLTGLADVMRAQLALVLGGEAPDVSERMRDALIERKGRLSPGDLLRMLNSLAELEQRFKKSSQQQLLLETWLVRLALMDRTVSLEEVLHGFRGGSSGEAHAPAPATAAREPGGGVTAGPVARPAGAAGDWRAVLSDAEPARTPSRETPPRETPPHETPPRETSPRETPHEIATVANADRGPDDVVEPLVRRAPMSANALSERWEEIISLVRSDGRALLAAAMASASPIGVSAQGVITVQLDEPDEIRAHALEGGRSEILNAIQTFFDGAARITVRTVEGTAARPPRRITDESVRSDRIASLRKRDPVLGAAVDALDLELLD